MSNIASFARIDGEIRFRDTEPPAHDPDALANWFELRKLDRLERVLSALRGDMAEQTRAIEALKAFGLPSGLPATTNGKTTVRAPVVLPADITATLRRVRASRRTCSTCKHSGRCNHVSSGECYEQKVCHD